MKRHIDEQYLALLAGDDLDPKRKAEVLEHLADCPRCRQILDAFLDDRKYLATLKEQSTGVFDHAMLRHPALITMEPGKKTVNRLSLRWAVSMASLLIVVMISFLFLGRNKIFERSAGLVSATMQSFPEKKSIVSPMESNKARIRIYPKRQLSKKLPHSYKPKNAAVQEVSVLPGSNAATNPLRVDNDIVIRLETEDPNISIIWLANN
jgi:hypothetical protein